MKISWNCDSDKSLCSRKNEHWHCRGKQAEIESGSSHSRWKYTPSSSLTSASSRHDPIDSDSSCCTGTSRWRCNEHRESFAEEGKRYVETRLPQRQMKVTSKGTTDQDFFENALASAWEHRVLFNERRLSAMFRFLNRDVRGPYCSTERCTKESRSRLW